MWAPMLAPLEEPLGYPQYWEVIKRNLPLYLSPKIDGYRGVVKEGLVKSRKYIDLPSRQVQSCFGAYTDLDGELIVGSECDENVFNRTSSYVRSFDKPAPDLTYRIFDFASQDLVDEPFEIRLDFVTDYVASLGDERVTVIPQHLVHTIEEILVWEEHYLEMGYEGVMLRTPHGRYKGGLKKANRCTMLEGIIFKLKRMEDFEAQVTGFEEGTTNTNEDVRDNLGNAKRSSCKAGMVPAGTVGKFLIEYNGQTEKVAPGSFKKDELEFIWNNQSCFLGKWLAVRHFPHGAVKKLRMARAKGFRDEMDK